MHQIKAQALFPLPHRIREATGTSFSYFPGIPPRVAKPVIEAQLTHDPGSVNLLFRAILQELRLGNLERARELGARMDRVGPGMEKTLFAQELLSKLSPE
jgi:hypothetical protein